MNAPSHKASKTGPPGGPTLSDYQRVKGGIADEPEPGPLPSDETLTLQRGAILHLCAISNEAWRWSVRWPDAREKDPMLAAGGWATDVALSRDAAEAAGRAAFAKGPPRREER